MTGVPRRLLAAAVGAGLVIVAVVLGFALRGDPRGFAARQPGERPELLLLTGLPIVFPESFSLESSGSPALAALEQRYRVLPISLADAKSLAGRKLLLMAQPQAQPAEALVELDKWVRNGGRVLLLADPALQWPSEKALGDPTRPPAAFADTGLLAHWGLRLDSPVGFRRAKLEADGRRLETASPGTLVATSKRCSVTASGLIARCSVGAGEVIVIADADLIDSHRFARSNLDILLAELERLEQ